ncbi:MAG: hypothetical protein HKP26_06630, partial [Nitrosopumilus sp.]|nr:hypothetical protein [Nitrosopumilus sp.]
MTFFKVSSILLILFLAPLVFFEIDDAFAAFPAFESKVRDEIRSTDTPSNLLNTTSLNTNGFQDRLLVLSVSIDNTNGPSTDTVVDGVSFGPSGDSCSVPANTANFTRINTATSTVVGETRNEIWYLVAPPESDCNILVDLSTQVGEFIAFGANKTSAVARTVLYSGAHQTLPINLGIGYTNSTTTTPISTTPNVTIPIGNGNSSQVFFDTVSTNDDSAPVAGPNQVRQNSYISSPGFGVEWSTAYSTQNGGLDNLMSYTFTTARDWAISAVVINSCDTDNSCTPAAAGSGSGSGSGSDDDNGSCHGDCSPPTLGIDKNNKRVVSNGFAFNDNPVDAELYFTPYPLITAYVGEENTIDLRIYENDGPSNLAHVGIAFGLGNGETFTESNAIINWDRDYDGTETISLIDPYNVLANVTVNVTEVECDDIGSKCTDVTVYHTFRAPLEFNMVATNIWDLDRNAWQNYFNHGLQVMGESLNPPNIHSGIYKGKIYQLTEIEKNKSVDDDGNTWTFDYGIWNKDYIDVKKTDRQLVNADKIWAINHVLKEDSVDTTYDALNYDRYHDQFSIQKEYQIILAENLLEEMCPKCFDDSFEEIDDISYYEFEESLKRNDNPEFVSTIEY